MTDPVEAFETLLSELAAAHPGKGKYLAIDRYRDFRMVFLANEQGRRVLAEIVSWGYPTQSSARRANFDPYRTMYHDGERSITLKVMATINMEPPAEQATQANSTVKKE